MTADRLDRIRAEQVAALYRSVPVAVLGALVGAFVLGAALVDIGGAPVWRVAFWVWLVAVGFTAHLVAWNRRRDDDAPERQWRFWARWFTAISLVEGLSWGLGAVFLTGSGDVAQQLLIMLVASVVASGAAVAFGTYLPAFYALSLPTMLPYLVFCLVRHDAIHDVLALLTSIFVVSMSILATRGNASFAEALRLRFENLDLAEDLRTQKAAAEAANLAKSRFLAAASHDLRQPVHALGMFVGALRGREMDAEARRLVSHIDRSVTAMDGLFSSLLDISRLDAGVVRSHIRALPIQPLLERICADQAAEASSKNIRLRLSHSRAVVETDPLLLERILRNIVVNAVHHTQRGGVLVGCRHAGGQVRVQVWDTGRGIPPELREQVFEEFYQIENPERDRAQGLGLGLAIVRRLTVLLGHELSLCSKPGRGSCFTVTLPAAKAADLPAFESAPAMLLQQGLILVVDDEAAIREAMGSLLTSWGHEVITAGSGAEMLALLETCPDVPDLVISDYRLRGEESGIDVVRRLQSEYNEDIPAMLITGDTAPDRLVEAQASGLLLLHKPVPNGRLRAAIGNLIVK